MSPLTLTAYKTTYYLNPTSYTAFASYSSEASLPNMTSWCGDGVIEGPEECEDGNTDSNDGCSSTCMTEICGDGIVQTSEECDDGNVDDTDGCT